MDISLRLRLDTTSDSLRVEFEPGKEAKSLDVKIEGSKAPMKVSLDADGYVLGVSIPGLAKFLAGMAGEKPGK